MGKSLGNVLEPTRLLKAYGADAVRFYFLKEIVFGQVVPLDYSCSFLWCNFFSWKFKGRNCSQPNVASQTVFSCYRQARRTLLREGSSQA